MDEAIFFSDRILVLSPRPGRIMEEVRVDLPRPREADAIRGSRQFAKMREHLWSLLSQGGHCCVIRSVDSEYARPASRDAYLRIGVVGTAGALRCAAAISAAAQRDRARLCDDDAVWRIAPTALADC